MQPDQSLAAFVELDITNSTLTLSFSETVNSSSLDPTGLSLHNSFAAGGTSYTLTGGTTNSTDGSTVVINLSVDDLNALKALQRSTLCSGFQNCYIRINPRLIQDMSDNRIEALTNSLIPTFEGALSPTGYRPDTIRPNLVAFDLDLTAEILTLSFDETVDYLSFRSEFISIQGEFDSSFTITLDPVLTRRITNMYETTVQFRLSMDDIFNLKSQDTIATEMNDTYIVFTSAMIMDIAGLDVVERESAINPLPVNNYTRDSIPPEVTSFTELDMNTGVLRISFSEPVLPQDVSFTGITLQSTMLGGGSSVTLTGGTVTSDNAQSTTLAITFSTTDIRDIKVFNDLGRDIFTSYLSVIESGFSDAAGNPVLPINSSTAVQANSYRTDFTRPTLTGYEFDLNMGLLVLTFDDAVEPFGFDPTQITLHSATDATLSSTISYQLTGYAMLPTTTDNYVLNVTLLSQDLNNIKATVGLLSSPDTTYLSTQGQAIRDLFGNFLQSIEEGQTLLTSNFTGDSTPPNLNMFSLDLNIGALVLMFDESVNITNFSPAGLTLQNARNASENDTITLTLSANGFALPNTSANHIRILFRQ